jgi:hypothetical protein
MCDNSLFGVVLLQGQSIKYLAFLPGKQTYEEQTLKVNRVLKCHSSFEFSATVYRYTDSGILL